MKHFIWCLCFILLGFLATTSLAGAHPGNTDASGCHTCRTNCPNWGLSYGQYHCHNSKSTPQPVTPIRSHYGSNGTGYTEAWPSYNYSPIYTPSTPTCPLHSYYDGISSCKCNYGYVVSGDQCVSGNTFCRREYGLFSSYDSLSKSCECDSGYSLNSLGMCTKDYSSSSYTDWSNLLYESSQASCPAHSTKSLEDPSACTCDSGYQPNSKKDKCVLTPRKTYDKMCREDFGKNSKWDGKRDEETSCICKKGYVWGEKDTCIKEPSED